MDNELPLPELNEKHAAFCKAYAMYNNASEAARVAGYSTKSAHTQGSRLLKRPEIQERIELIQSTIGIDLDVMAELEEQYNYAKNNNHTSSALKALEVLSKLKNVEEVETPRTIKEIQADIVKDLEILGEEESSSLLLKCKWYNRDVVDKVDTDEHDLPSFTKLKELEAEKEVEKEKHRYSYRSRRKAEGRVLI